MTMYEKNIKTLADYYPEMDQRIMEARAEQKQVLEIFEETSCDGEKILKIKKDDRICYLNGKRNAVEAAQSWVKTLGDLVRDTPVLMMGIGNFSYLKELAEQTKKRLTIIIYEPSLQIFLKFLEMTDIRKWMEKHVIIFWVDGLDGMDEKNMQGLLGAVLRYEMLDHFKHFILPNYETLFSEKAVEFMKVCRDVAVKALTGYQTNRIFAGVMVKNLFSNARYLCDGYKTTQLIEVIPRDIPGIVVAAGPSLDKNIHDLKKAKGKAFIVAVDTAIKPLLRVGIVPDLFAVIDALKPIELVRIEGAQEIPLLTTLNASPDVLDYHKGMKFFFNESYQFAEKIYQRSGHKEGGVETGGSVATHLFSLLHKIGLNTIILVGQDLAYTNDKSYADGTFQDTMEKVDTSQFIKVEGNYEKEVPTKTDLKIFLDWYNMYIEGLKERKKDFRVINATEGGAKINNTEIMTLQEAIAQECSKEVDIQECLKKLPPMLDEEARKWTIEYLQSLSEEFQQVEEKSRGMKKLYRKLDKISDKKNIDKNEYLSIMKKIDKQRKSIEKISVYQLIAMTMNNAHFMLLGDQYMQQKSLQKEGKEIAEIGLAFIQDVERLAAAFGKYADEIFSDLS
jgi:hypothetical protein